MLAMFMVVGYDANIPREQVRNELIVKGIAEPDVVLQIAILESGLKKKRNNLFGFRSNKAYFKFDTWQESIVYYKKWEDKHYGSHLFKFHKKSKCDYYHFIKAIGYVDGHPNSKANTLYVNKLKKIKV